MGTKGLVLYRAVGWLAKNRGVPKDNVRNPRKGRPSRFGLIPVA